MKKSLMWCIAQLLYPIYNNVMGWSSLISVRYNLGIWKLPIETFNVALDSITDVFESSSDILYQQYIKCIDRLEENGLELIEAETITDALFKDLFNYEITNDDRLYFVLSKEYPGARKKAFCKEPPLSREDAANILNLSRDNLRYQE